MPARCPAAAASSRSRTSPLTPLRPSSPLRSARSSSTSSSDLPVCFMITRQGERIEVARRGCSAASPTAGSCPSLVATLWPSRMAHSELEPPRWQEMIRRSLRPSSSAVRVGDVAMAGAVKAPALDVILLGPLVRSRRSSGCGRESCDESRSRTPPPAESPAAFRSAAAWPRCRADCGPARLRSSLPSPPAPRP